VKGIYWAKGIISKISLQNSKQIYRSVSVINKEKATSSEEEIVNRCDGKIHKLDFKLLAYSPYSSH